MNEMTGIIQEIITAIKEVSPHVWAVLLKQVQLDAYSNLFFGVLCFSPIIVLTILIWRHWAHITEEYETFDISMGGVILYLLPTVMAIAGIDIFLLGVKMLLNPEFYAIQYLIEGLQ